MQTVVSKYWSLNVRPSKPTKYTPTQHVRLTNVALSADLKDESATRRTSLRVYVHGTHSVVCSLTPTKIDQAVVDIVLVKGTEFTLEVIGHNDLSLSGYEFYDNVVPGMRQDGQQEINNGNRSETATSKGPEEEKPADLIIVDKIIGEGPPVEKTSIVHFLYMILKTDGTEVGGSGGKGVPAMLHMDDTQNTMPALVLGLMGMHAGGERKLLVPPHLGKAKRPVEGVGQDQPFFLYLKLESVEPGEEIL